MMNIIMEKNSSCTILLNDFSPHMNLHESHNLTFLSTENQIESTIKIKTDGQERLLQSNLCPCPSCVCVRLGVNTFRR